MYIYLHLIGHGPAFKSKKTRSIYSKSQACSIHIDNALYIYIYMYITLLDCFLNKSIFKPILIMQIVVVRACYALFEPSICGACGAERSLSRFARGTHSAVVVPSVIETVSDWRLVRSAYNVVQLVALS